MCSLCALDNGDTEKGKYFAFFGYCKPCYSSAVDVLLHLAVYIFWVILNLFVANQYTIVHIIIDWMQLMYADL